MTIILQDACLLEIQFSFVVSNLELGLILQVRDRATLYLNAFGGDASSDETDEDVKDFIFGTLDAPLVNLEASLQAYVSKTIV